MTTRDRGVLAAMVIAITGALARLAQLGWLHPLSTDEREFFLVSRWISEGRLPYRDFWEHHTPLTWFLFAPVTRLTDSPGVDAVLLMRWAQIPVWIATFWLANIWMRNAGLSPFARWSAMALGLCNSLFMLAAVEFRVDPLGCLLIMAGLVLMQGTTARSAFGAGAALCLAGFANLRFGPVIVLTALLLRVVDTRARAWGGALRVNWLFAGATVTLAVSTLYFLVTGSLDEFLVDVFRGNYLFGKFVQDAPAGFLNRLLSPFGVNAGGGVSWPSVDAGGIATLLLGFTGLALALARWRKPDDLFVIAFVQAGNVLFIAAMKMVHNYHFELVVVLMLPLVAMTIERIPKRAVVFSLLAVAWCVNLFASFFRGKELDLAYQDLVLREIHARTSPRETVWGGMVWNVSREPPYRLFFLPPIAPGLVKQGYEPPYELRDVIENPPGAVVVDEFANYWLAQVQRELAPYFLRHYIPAWRNLWIPGLNVRLLPGHAFQWVIPRDGTYHAYVSRTVGEHPWFRRPFYLVSRQSTHVRWPLLDLPPSGNDARLQWWIDGQPATVGTSIALRKGQRIAVSSSAAETLGVILLPTNDRVLLRQPPNGVTIEGWSPRVTHVPDFHARIE